MPFLLLKYFLPYQKEDKRRTALSRIVLQNTYCLLSFEQCEWTGIAIVTSHNVTR